MKTLRSVIASATMAGLALATAAAASGAARTPTADASIPFGLIRDWQADREVGMWIQAYSRKWYYAEFMGRCLGLHFATAVGFDTRYQTSFDRWSSVIVPGYGRCPIQKLSLSERPPPRKTRKNREEPTEQAAEVVK